MCSDNVLRNHAAWNLLQDLANRGIHLCVQHGNLATRTPGALTDADRQALRQQRPDLLVLVLVWDHRTQGRLAALWGGQLGRVRFASGCELCGQEEPVRHNLCGWCALACRLHAGAPVPHDVLSLFPTFIRGVSAGVLSGRPCFGMKVSA